MKYRNYLVILAVLFLSACSLAPTLKEIDESKPAVFKAQVAPIPKECGTIPTPPTDLTINQYEYSESHWTGNVLGSKIVPELIKEWRAARKPLIDWGSKNNQFSDQYISKGDIQAGKCVVAFLDEWARANALLGKMSGKDLLGPHHSAKFPPGTKFPVQVHDPIAKMSNYYRMSTTTEAAILYFKTQDLATPEQDARIKWWLNQVTKQVKHFWATSGDWRNNHLAWTGVGILQIGIITNNKEDIDYARKIFDEQLSVVKNGVSVDWEIRRGSRSFFFHNYKLEALTLMAQTAKLIGEDWWSDPRLQKMMTVIADAQVNPEAMKAFEKHISGIKQDIYAPWGWYGLLPDNDPRRVRFMEFLKSGPVASNPWNSSNYNMVMMTRIPVIYDAGGDPEILRDLIEKRAKK